MERSSILIVEDDDDLRESLTETVERAGYRVETARHGGEALARLAQDGPPPDVILLDLMMPIVDGWTVLRHLEASGRRIPVVVVSAARAPGLRATVAFVPKPSRKAELLAAIASRCPPRIVESPAKVIATLYVAAGCARSARARSVLASVLETVEPGEVDCRVIDVASAPSHTSAPTLVLERPLRLTMLDGPLEPSYLLGLFSIAEVQRRRR